MLAAVVEVVEVDVDVEVEVDVVVDVDVEVDVEVDVDVVVSGAWGIWPPGSRGKPPSKSSSEN